MKARNLLTPLVLFFCIVNLVSCSDDKETKEIYPLLFEKGYYEIPFPGTTRIGIQGGNREYAISVENSNILEVSVDLSSPIGNGTLVVTPKSKGETTVTIKDNVTGETVNLKLKVVDCYLCYFINESNHPALSKGTVIYFVHNENKDCYFFRSNSDNTVDAGVGLKGTYDFSVKPYLTLNYASDEEGKFTDAAIPKVAHDFKLDFSDGITTTDIVISLLRKFLDVDLTDWVQNATKSIGPRVPMLKMTVDNTDYTIIGVLDTSLTIPENVIE